MLSVRALPLTPNDLRDAEARKLGGWEAPCPMLPALSYIPITIATLVVPEPPMLRVAIFFAPSIW